mmetsp:Transcript_20241/g.56152  ORF Transcript_20241/g.56152 Transcript_20241/m.56152 type:complete len:205 (+) Transcript_20241:1968-2582(+)
MGADSWGFAASAMALATGIVATSEALRGRPRWASCLCGTMACETASLCRFSAGSCEVTTRRRSSEAPHRLATAPPAARSASDASDPSEAEPADSGASPTPRPRARGAARVGEAAQSMQETRRPKSWAASTVCAQAFSRPAPANITPSTNRAPTCLGSPPCPTIASATAFRTCASRMFRETAIRQMSLSVDRTSKRHVRGILASR